MNAPKLASEWADTMPVTTLQTTSVELSSVLNSICPFLRRYVVFSSAAQPTATALWVAHTWALDGFDYTPYLRVDSPEKQCGKSRLLDCLERITPKAWGTISPSEAVLFREIDRDCPTLLLDETDTLFCNGKDDRAESLRAMLNAGFERKARVPRCVGQGSSFGVQHFAVFCAKAFAGIGSLPDTIRDRCISIRLVRKSRDESVERFSKARGRGYCCSNFCGIVLRHWRLGPSARRTLQCFAHRVRASPTN